MASVEDREKWRNAWSSRLERTLPEGCKVDVNLLVSGFGRPVRITIAADPPEFAKAQARPSAICPVCGQATEDAPRVAASLDVENACGYGTLIGVWVHAGCLERCPVLGPAKHVP